MIAGDSVCKLWEVSTVFQQRLFASKLSKLLDTQYTYSKIECWKELAKAMAISPEIYETFGFVKSEAEKLFEILESLKPELTVEQLKIALEEIENVAATDIIVASVKGNIS